MELQEGISLAEYTTLRVGGPALRFACARSAEDVAEACVLAAENRWPVLILGGGSNLLVSDQGFPGLALRVEIQGVHFQEHGERVQVTAGAGESWDGMVQRTVERGLAGIECLAGIPGTVGGTPVQNVGAYGQEIAQTLVSARCFDRETSTLIELSRADFGFGYRTSILNTSARERYVVLDVTFALTPGGKPCLDYADLKRHFDELEQPSLIAVAAAVRQIRGAKGMVIDANDPDSRSAGSFFGNPIVESSVIQVVAEKLHLSVAEVPHWPAEPGMVKLPAAWLLERAGFVRGYVLGQAGISTKHTLALVNRGGATAAEIMVLRDHIVAEVLKRFDILLQQEPVQVG